MVFRMDEKLGCGKKRLARILNVIGRHLTDALMKWVSDMSSPPGYPTAELCVHCPRASQYV